MTPDKTLTAEEGRRRAGQWNAYSSRNVQLHCPTTGRQFIGSGNTCPFCSASLTDLSHWKWYSPDEEHPRNSRMYAERRPTWGDQPEGSQ